MTIENCWYELDMPKEAALKSSYELPKLEQGQEFGVWTVRSLDIFNYDWLKSLYQKGLVISEALIFYRSPGHNTDYAHLDIHREHPKRVSTFAMNMIIGGGDAYMSWYKTPHIDYRPTQGPAGSVYYNWPVGELEEIDRHTLSDKCMTLVRVGIPHAIFMGNEPRWCISARGQSALEQMYWKDITQWMRDKKLLIERDNDVC